MKLMKMFGLLAVAAALMAFVGTASASVFTSPKGTIYTSTFKATSTNFVLHGSFTSIECKHSSVEGKVEQHGMVAGTTVNAGGKVSSLTFSGCTGGTMTPVINPGTLVINSKAEVYSNGLEFTAHTSVGECIFTSANTKLGIFNSSANDTSSATWGLGSATVHRTGGSFFCGTWGTLTGSYTFAQPLPLYLN
jgi:hypothetical protein